MAIPIEYTAAEGPQEHKRGEGRVYTYDIANKTSSTPSNISVTVSRVDDNEDVTSDFIPSGTHTASGTVITLAEIQPPSNAQIGDYEVEIQFDAGGYEPGFEYILLCVW